MTDIIDKIITRNADLSIEEIIRIAQDYGYTIPEIKEALKRFIDALPATRIHSV